MNEKDEDKKLGLRGGQAQIMSPLMSPKMSAFYDTSAPSFMSSSPRMNFKQAPDPSSEASEASISTSLPLSKRPRISTTPKLATVSTSLPYTTAEDTDISLFDDDNEDNPDDDDFLDGFELGNPDDDDDVSDEDETRHNDISSDDGSGDNDGDNEDDEDDTKKLKIINRMLRKLTSVNNDKDVNMKSLSGNDDDDDDDVTDDDSDGCESVLRMPLPSPYRVPIVCDPPPPTPPPSRLGTLDESDSAFSLYNGPGVNGGNNTPRVLEFLSPSFLNNEGAGAQNTLAARNSSASEEDDVEIKMPVALGSLDGKITPSLYELSHSNITCKSTKLLYYTNFYENYNYLFYFL